jgi:hypothetical protein
MTEFLVGGSHLVGCREDLRRAQDDGNGRGIYAFFGFGDGL